MGDFEVMKMKQALYDAVAGISQNRFLSERPKILNDKVNDLVVVVLPSIIQTPVYGYGYGASYSICRIELYARDLASGENIAKLDTMLKDTITLFPISKGGVLVSRPRVVMKGSDDNGFHVVFVNAEISVS
jgi:hypothetical protein